MVKQRFIFDLDSTVIIGHYDLEDQYFQSVLSETDAAKFLKVKYSLLMQYEDKFSRYDVHLLSRFLTQESGVVITPKMIQEWIQINSNMDNDLIPGVVDSLEYLKRKDKSLVVLTNWFRSTQIGRLKKVHLLDYFDEVYGGDYFLKPSKYSFLQACGDRPIEECVMIGDDLRKDIYSAMNIGMDAIYYQPQEVTDFDKTKVKSIQSMKKIKEMY